MSYILDALQKSSAASSTDTLETQPRTETAGLSLPWKLAIGAVLATNLVLLYLWQSDRGNAASREPGVSKFEMGNQTSEETQLSRSPQPQRPLASNSQRLNPTNTNSGDRKKTLPGIASPRAWPPPASTKTNSGSAGSARTFKPTGAPITIADAEAPREPLINPAPPEETPQTKPPVAERSVQAEKKQQTPGRQVSQLSELSESARQSLYVLTFSFHIYAEDADLRAVVVNGRRLTEGSTIESDGNQNFELVEILENGVVVKFVHEGTTNSVQIPVMEDWKDA